MMAQNTDVGAQRTARAVTITAAAAAAAMISVVAIWISNLLTLIIIPMTVLLLTLMVALFSSLTLMPTLAKGGGLIFFAQSPMAVSHLRSQGAPGFLFSSCFFGVDKTSVR